MIPKISRFLRTLSLFSQLRRTGAYAPLPGGVLDEQVALLNEIGNVAPVKPIDLRTAANDHHKMRIGIRVVRFLGLTVDRVRRIENCRMPLAGRSLPIRIYRPSLENRLPTLLFFHGGGFVSGDLDTHDPLCRSMARRTGCLVIAVDYRRAPEFPFPAAPEDAFETYLWLSVNAAELGADPRRILVAGDSAGGNLSAVVCLMAKERGAPQPAGQVLLYPALSGPNRQRFTSFRKHGKGVFGLTAEAVRWYVQQYMPDPQTWTHPHTAPLLAKDKRGLAPALVVTAEYDMLRDEGELYAAQLQKAGVPAMVLRCNGMPHGFASLAGFIKRGQYYLDQVCSEISRMVEKQRSSSRLSP